MFKVIFREECHTWKRYEFRFDTLEEAHNLVDLALKHVVTAEEEGDNLVIEIRYYQEFTTDKEETDED